MGNCSSRLLKSIAVATLFLPEATLFYLSLIEALKRVQNFQLPLACENPHPMSLIL
jgi:hypothetical protein